MEPLNVEDTAHLEAKRSWVREHHDETARQKYETLEGKLALLEVILKNNWIEPSETVKLQCLGITLGDALVQKLGLQWVAVEDEYGRDPALSKTGTSILLFPMTAISKRIEHGEEVDVRQLFGSLCETVEQNPNGWV